jgi:hypothetical protein
VLKLRQNKEFRNKFVILKLVLVVFLATLFWFALPFEFPKFTLEEAYPSQNLSPGCQVEFEDLNGDGEVELIIGTSKINEQIPTHYIEICDIKAVSGRHVIEAINFDELFVGSKKFITADFNGDSRKELLVPFFKEDSLYIGLFTFDTINNRFSSEPWKQVYIDSANRYKGYYQVQIEKSFVNDFDKDGWDEILFTLNNGYAVYPRRHYIYNARTNTVTKSRFTGSFSWLTDTLRIANRLLFTTEVPYLGNIDPKDTVHYENDDYHPYLVVLNDSLQPLFKPIRGAHPPGEIAGFFSTDSCVITLNVFRRKINSEVGDTQFNVLKKYNLKGELLQTKELKSNEWFALKKMEGKVFLFNRDGNTFEITDDLKLKASEYNISSRHILNKAFDLDNDGYLEEVSIDPLKGEIYFKDIDNNESYTFTGKTFAEDLTKPVKVFKNKDRAYIAIVSNTWQLKMFEFKRNPKFWLSIPYAIFLLGMSYVLVSLLFTYQEKRLAKETRIKEELSRLQLLNIKNQVDPHFTLNALNSIDAMYRAGEEEKASNYMVRFSRMIHQTLMSSENISSTLKDELEFVAHYCKLEEYKAVNGFEYDVDVEEGINLRQIEIPKHLVFTYVENAIKHGLRPKEKDTKLVVEVSKEQQNIVIKVKDNGIGYKGSEQIKTSGTKRGLNLVKEILVLYKQMKNRDITIKTEHKNPGESDFSTITSILLRYKKLKK